MSGNATPKQRKFAELVISGASLTDAYRAAYDAKSSSPETVATEAARLIRNPHVAPIIAEGRRQAMESAVCTRMTLLGRLEAVNRAAFEQLTAEGESMSQAALRAFMETSKELREECIDDRFGVLAQNEHAARTSPFDIDAMFGHGAWFADTD